ncbi:MAG: Nif11 family protein [Synergistaceae bacterium]|nr:Nif11 family protein [Synergistaceae bacterium]
MSLSSAERFLKDLLTNPSFLLKIAELPEAEIAPALRQAGFNFTSREIDDLVCKEFYNIKNRLHLGEGDVRDLIMQKWGKYMP